MNVAEDWPAGILTFAGTLAFTLLDASVTVTPTDGAGPVNVTVPIELFPPAKALGASVNFDRAGGFTVSVALTIEPVTEAEITALVTEETGTVVIVKVAKLEPCGTVTVAGGTEEASVELRVTTVPPLGAGAARVTVPIEFEPPINE